MNNSVILILILGLALVVAAVVLLGISTGKTAPAPEALLPSEVEGFTLTMKLDRVEPSPSSEEEYSAHAFFAPATEEFVDKVDSLGIAIFRFKSEEAAKTAKEALIKGLKIEIIEITGGQYCQVCKKTLELFYQAGQVGIIWHEGRLLYEVLVTSPMGSESADIEILKEAARRGAQALIK